MNTSTSNIVIDLSNNVTTTTATTKSNNINNILFLCVFDYGSRELGLNHLTSLTKNGIHNYVAYVTDRKTYKYVKNYGFNVVLEDNVHSNISKNAKEFGTRDFNMFSYLRYKIISKLLEKNVWVWYMDVDTVVMPGIQDIDMTPYMKQDIVFQHDCHMICTGCALYQSNSRTANFTYFVWKNVTDALNDQNFMVELYKGGKLNGLYIDTFDNIEFPNGLLYFDTEDRIPVPEEIMEIKRIYRANTANKKTAFVHANWMIGVDVKIQALKSRNLWCFVKNDICFYC